MFTTARNEIVALVAIVATSGAFPSGSAQAEFLDPEIPAVAVHYSDLDLTSDAGVKALYRRLQFAAKQVCGGFPTTGPGQAMKYRACYRQALSEAVAKVNVETLSVMHRNARTRPRVS